MVSSCSGISIWIPRLNWIHLITEMKDEIQEVRILNIQERTSIRLIAIPFPVWTIML